MPRRNPVPPGDRPWQDGDPGKKININLPFAEPLMIKLDYLIENRAIFSKSSFIRDVVGKAADEELRRLARVREAVRQLDERERKKKR